MEQHERESELDERESAMNEAKEYRDAFDALTLIANRQVKTINELRNECDNLKAMVEALWSA